MIKFSEILKDKAALHDKVVIEVDQYYASSQICNICGYQYKKVKDISIREWKCPQCNNTHDRDVNAAINILREGRSKMDKSDTKEIKLNMEYNYKVVD